MQEDKKTALAYTVVCQGGVPAPQFAFFTSFNYTAESMLNKQMIIKM